jgi:hypothetical protein
MQDHGKRGLDEQVERVFWTLLAHISSLHDAIESAANLLEQTQWNDDLNAMRQTDPLLFYLWQARNSEVHDSILKWHHSSSIEIRITDPSKATSIIRQFYPIGNEDSEIQRLMMYVYDVHTLGEMIQQVIKGVAPSPERIAAAGIELKNPLRSLRLYGFKTRIKGRLVGVDRPSHHLDREHQPDASLTGLAIEFYRSKVAEMRAVSLRQ